MQTIRTDQARKAVLGKISKGLSISAACRSARISRNAYYDWLKDEAEFAADVADAIEAGTDLLEDSATNQAIDGNTALMALLLKARRPEKYKDRFEQQHTGPNGTPLTITIAERSDGPA
jgi:hypothetical protein